MSYMTTPEDEVAHRYMERKGYGDIQPFDVEKLDDEPCWYFIYDLDEGRLELEVSWSEPRMQWDTRVTAFKVA